MTISQKSGHAKPIGSPATKRRRTNELEISTSDQWDGELSRLGVVSGGMARKRQKPGPVTPKCRIAKQQRACELELPSAATYDGETKLKKARGAQGRTAIPLKYIGDEPAKLRHFNNNSTTLLRQAKELSVTTGSNILVLMQPEEGRVHSFCNSLDVEGAFNKCRGRKIL